MIVCLPSIVQSQVGRWDSLIFFSSAVPSNAQVCVPYLNPTVLGRLITHVHELSAKTCTHFPRDVCGEPVTGARVMHAEHWVHLWASCWGQETTHPKQLMGRSPEGICKAINRIHIPLPSFEPWLLWVSASLICSQPFPVTQLCWSPQYSGWGNKELDLLDSVPHSWENQMLTPNALTFPCETNHRSKCSLGTSCSVLWQGRCE